VEPKTENLAGGETQKIWGITKENEGGNG